MAFSFIEEDTLYDRIDEARKYMIPLFEPLDEYERIARNKPHAGIAKEMPKVTDGTLSSHIQEQPKRIIQQPPTGSIIANDKKIEITAGFILNHTILPNANQQASLIQKAWAMTSKALTYGSQPAFVQFVNRGDYFGTDFTLPYIRDILFEPGKVSDRDSNYLIMKAWYQPNQLDAIIKKETMLVKNSADRKDAIAYESGWDLKMLAKLKDQLQQKDRMSLSPSERTRQAATGFIEIDHVFQRGLGATFYSYAPSLKAVVRRKVNKDPRGAIPIHYMYANMDLSNPLGRGAVEIAGGLQNLLDSEVQSYQYMRALLMNPPLKVRGDVSSSMLKYAPNALWRLGTNPQNDVEPAKLESASLMQFTQNYAMLKSQIMNLLSSNDNSTPASSGNSTSKTPAGVDASQMHLGIGDNYMRRQFESTFEEIINTMLNLYFAERSGVQEITLNQETADKLRDLDPEPEPNPQTGEMMPVAPSIVSKDNKIRLDFDHETPILDFKADPTSSTVANDAEQILALKEVLAETSKNPYIPYLLQADGKEIHIGEVYEQLFERFGVRNLDKIITEIPIDPKTGKPKPPTAMTPFFDKPHVSATFKDLPPAAQVQLLANGGINIQESDVLQPNIEQMAGGRLQNPVQPAYIDQATGQIMSGHPPMGQGYVDPQTGQPTQPEEGSMKDHPIIQMMTTLDIKFTDLPQSSQMILMRELGILDENAAPEDQVTASAQKLKIEAANTAIKASEVAHKMEVHQSNSDQAAAEHVRTVTNDNNSHALASHNAALEYAKTMHPEHSFQAQADAQPPLASKTTQAQQGAVAS